jgi:diguanylate cyclase (GGDEF)-like protein/PAS domain S-box-containing protein
MTPYDFPQTPASTPEERQRAERHLYTEQVRLLYRFSLVGYLATLMVAFILGAILWQDLEQPALFAWFAAISLITVARYALYKVFVNANPPAERLAAWEWRFLAGSTVAALCWAVLGTALLPVDPANRMAVAMLVALLATGAVAYNAPHPFAFKITAFVTLVPLAISLFLSGARAQMLLSGAVLILAGLLPVIHTKVYRALLTSLSARLSTVMLSSRLQEEHHQLELTSEKLAEEMLQRIAAQQKELLSAQRLRVHVERTPFAVIEWDRDFRVAAWNPAAEGMFGWDAAQAIGKPAGELLCAPESRPAFEAMWSELVETPEGNKTQIANVTSRGRTIHCEWYNTPLVDAAGKPMGFASLVQDITERLNTERTIHYMAHHDALTGLPNRRLMQDRLNQAIMQARRNHRYVAVLFIDVDRFKLLNDTLGHDTGDFILKDIAKRLAGAVREADTVSREGGDEFIVILPDLDRPESARTVADKIMQEISGPVEIAGQELHVTTSIGISHFPNDATDVNQLLKHADSAMYQAKEAGRNTIRYFTSDLNFLLGKRLEVESKLRKGIDNEEFFLRYQPQVDLPTGRITGMEALIRWNDPVKGEVWPKDFIYIAEELGLIVPLGEWVFRTACRQLRIWTDEGLGTITVSINISPRQFMSRKLVASLLAIVRETGADPRRIELEITETMLMRNLEQSREVLEQLCKAGMRIAVDDFGVGYSSLGQLRRLPVQGLKIDREFIAGVTTDPATASITEAIIAMAKRLKLRVIAEGVETHQQLEFLRANFCDAFQGYHFSQPITALEATAMLRAQGAPLGNDEASAA